MADNVQGPEIKSARRVRTVEDRDAMFTDEPEVSINARNALDKPKAIRLHGRLMNLYTSEIDRQAENRRQQAEDEDFYDNEQWSEEDRKVMADRGQYPLTYNVIKTSVDWVLGTQRRQRTEYKILPRRKEAGQQAEKKSQLMKYLDDVNRTGFDVSQAFQDGVKVGIGWVETSARDDDDDEPVMVRHESWRNMLWDSACTQKDLSDCRYVARSRFMDLDVAASMFPDRKELLRGVVSGAGGEFDVDNLGDEAMDDRENAHDALSDSASEYDRQRVRVIEMWYRTPVKVDRMKGGEFTGEIYDEYSPGHVYELEAGNAELVKRVTMRMHVAIMTSDGLLWSGPSPYRHNDFPFTPIWGNRRGRDGMPYGLIRILKDPQRDVNKRAAKALHILSTNKVLFQEGAFEDEEAARDELSRPDAFQAVKDINQINLGVDRELSSAHLNMMERSISMIQQVGGVTDENLGRSTNATSGRAIERRQDQGSLATSLFFDNLMLARQIIGSKELSLIEQFFSEQKQFRITNSRGVPQYIDVNDGLPQNDITRTKADYLITEESWNTTLRESQVEQLVEMISQLAPVAPQLAMTMMDLVVESMDITNREEIVKRIRAVTGQRDPDAEEPTQEEIQRQQQQEQERQIAQRKEMAQISKDEAQARNYDAQAQHRAGEAQSLQVKMQQLMADMASTNVDTQKKALEAAMLVVQSNGAEQIADSMMHESGFQSQTEKDETARQQAVIEGEQQRQAMEQQQQQQAQQQAQQQQAQQQQAMQQQQRQQEQEVLDQLPPGYADKLQQRAQQQSPQQDPNLPPTGGA